MLISRTRPAASAALLVGLASILAGSRPAVADEPLAAGRTVRLVVDFGDGVEWHFTKLPWRKGLTVADALHAAAAHKRGVPIRTKGSGATTLVVEVGNLKNEGGAADARNWLYWVNDQSADVGAGARELQPGDRVLWKFAKYE